MLYIQNIYASLASAITNSLRWLRVRKIFSFLIFLAFLLYNEHPTKFIYAANRADSLMRWRMNNAYYDTNSYLKLVRQYIEDKKERLLCRDQSR